jgi:hypothetical protein
MDDYGEVPGARDVRDVLASDPFAAIVGKNIERSVVVGAMLFVVIVLMIVLGPASNSRFIYTDF